METGNQLLSWKEQNGLIFFQFPHLLRQQNVMHAVFSRKGGVSSGPYQSLNVGGGLSDDAACVKENRARISALFDGAALISMHQVHGQNVAALGKDGFENGESNPGTVPKADALVSNLVHKMLMVQAADCQAVLLFDPVKKVAANVHSGWRGSIQNIIGETVAVMQREFGTRPADILAGIGPSLGPCCAEFVNYAREIPEAFWDYKDDTNRFDFWAMSADQLKAAGVAEENICNCRICTRCRSDLFFSFRGEGVTGRFAAVIGVR